MLWLPVKLLCLSPLIQGGLSKAPTGTENNDGLVDSCIQVISLLRIEQCD